MDISTLENERRRAIQQQGEERMGVSGGWNVAREPNMEDSPYRLFKEDYDEWGFGVEEDGQGFFTPIPRIPFDERAQTNNNMMIAHGEYFDDEGEPIENAPYIFNRNTTELEVPWLKEDYYKDLPRRKELHDMNYHT